MKRAQCDKCGRMWAVSSALDTSRGYLCPDCEDKLMMRPYRTRTNVWESEEGR